MIRRAVIMLVAIVAILAQVAAGVAGPGSRLCVCSTCIVVEGQGDDCSPHSATASSASRLVLVGGNGCDGCHLIPLPDTAYSPSSSAPAAPSAMALPVAQVVDVLTWPPCPATPLMRHERQRIPSSQHLRVLRSVVMTC
jgi:hypothetical protein